jgi:triosephosphate isomerase
MRRLIIVANWKMHKTTEESLEFIRNFKVNTEVEVAIAPPFTSLGILAVYLKDTKIKLAAQNMYYKSKGAYTGEVSPVMLVDLGCEYVILGHSERREHFKEDDALINKKIKAAFEHGLVPILCVGERWEQREAGQTFHILKQELHLDLGGLTDEQVGRMVIAYEPIWAIGTGKTASPQDAEEGAEFIRKVVMDLYGKEAAQKMRVQYGGSVNPNNIKELLNCPNVDGALVGSASLDPQTFAKIIQGAEDLLG